jgi:DNA-binding MarR family transcriptional regulator
MTNSKDSTVAKICLPEHEPLRQFMECYGVAETHGVEIFGLVRQIAQTYDTILNEQMRDEQLTPQRWRLLTRMFVEEQAGIPSSSPTLLSRTHSLSKNTISAHLRALEESEMIERELDADDLRQFKIRLTDRARQLIINSTPGHLRFLNELADALTQAETDEFLRLLHKLHRSLVAHSGLPACSETLTESSQP